MDIFIWLLLRDHMRFFVTARFLVNSSQSMQDRRWNGVFPAISVVGRRRICASQAGRAVVVDTRIMHNVFLREVGATMYRQIISRAVGGALITVALGGPALALSPFTFVSATGTDAGACTPAAPCKTFNFAVAQTTVGGEVRALTPGNYVPVTITNSVKIIGVEGAGILRGPAGAAITVNTPSTASVQIVGLSIDGTLGAAGNNGIDFVQAGNLTIKNCIIRNMKNSGVNVSAAGPTKILIEDTLIEGTGRDGVDLIAARTGSLISATLNNVTINRHGGYGVDVIGNSNDASNVTLISNSTISNGFEDGIRVNGVGAVMRLARSVSANGSGHGVHVDSGKAESAGDNFLGGNALGPSFGGLTNIGRF